MRAMTVGAAWITVVALTACSAHETPDTYDAERRDAFVKDCTTADVPERLCRCFFDGVATHLPFDQFVLLDAKLADPSAEIPAEVADLAAECAAEQRYDHEP